MLSSIKKLFLLLTKSERRKFFFLALAMLVMGATEIAGIGAIAPFLSVVTNPSVIQDNQILSLFYSRFGFTDTRTFIIAVGIAVLGFVLLRNVTAVIVKYVEIRFAEMRGYRLSKRLMAKYLGQPYIYFLNKNYSEITRNVLSETSTVIRSFMVPLLDLITRLVTVFSITAFLIIMDPQIALIIATALVVLYGGIYIGVKKILLELGRKRLDANRKRFKLVREAFGGIKDVKLLRKESVFLNSFGKISKKTARYQSNSKIIGAFPKYALDTIVFGAMISMVLYMLFTREGGVNDSVPLLGLYGMAAYRIMPALNRVFKNIAKLRGSQVVVDTIYDELGDVSDEEERAAKAKPAAEKLPFDKEIQLKDIVFTYPAVEESDAAVGPVIKKQSLTIRKNTTVGFAGPTGCGKTTTVDIILGLLRPNQGRLTVDGQEITDENLRQWQANLGYVPQNIFLTDESIAKNIAFGVPEKKINHEQVRKAARIAHLDGFIQSDLPRGYETTVGEMGIRLSGGQRQRIGIARALYNDPEVLVLDEATSALDGITETIVMEAIEELSGKKTIILIAHRLSTLKEADRIFMMKRGEILARGTYDELLKENPQFQKMAR